MNHNPLMPNTTSQFGDYYTDTRVIKNSSVCPKQ